MDKVLLHNRYELLEEIGDGATATVYRARCTLLDRIVAVKILKEEYARDEGFVRKFRSEAQAAAQVSHPNIVNVFDVGEDDGRYFIVMEYVQGTTLKEYIASHAPLEPAEAVRIASEICDALEQAHAKGIIHRDIKPQNILVTADGTVKVADFGIARAPASGTITHSGNIMGSVYYISPEQARGTVLDRTTDIYSLGCVLYEMLTGRVPFDAEFPVTVALKHIHELPVEPRVLNPSIPVSLETVVLTAMSKHPGDRYQSAAAMKAAMQGLSLPAGGRRSGILRKGSARPARPEEEEGMPRRKRVLSPLGVAMLVVGVIGLVAGLTFGLRGSIFGKEVVVPLVEGLSASEAYQRLQEAGLTMTKAGEDFSAEVEKGSIISQDPPAQSRVKEGREVKVVVSKGKNMVDVPDLVGETLDDARLLLGNAGLEVGDVQKVFDDRAAEDTVIAQEPRSGQQVELGGAVSLTVSKGKQVQQTQVPDLVGMTLENAQALLRERQLTLGDITREDSARYFTGQVVRQTVPAGTTVETGSQVGIVVSNGPGPQEQTSSIQVPLPATQQYYRVVVTVSDVKGVREVFSDIRPGGERVDVEFTSYGPATVEVTLDGQFFKRYRV